MGRVVGNGPRSLLSDIYDILFARYDKNGGLLRHLAGRLDPFVDQQPDISSVRCSGQALGIDPCPMHALRAEMHLGLNRDGSSKLATVKSILSLPSLNRSRAMCRIRGNRAARDRRALVPVGLMLPAHSRLLHVLEGDRHRPGRPLAHPAVAEIGLVIVDRRRVAYPPAGAAAAHLVSHIHPPLERRHLRG